MAHRFLVQCVLCCVTASTIGCGADYRPEKSAGALNAAPTEDLASHGERRCHPSYRTLDVPGGTNADAFGINDWGQIVGGFEDATGQRQGFLREPNGAFTVLTVPGSASNVALDINNLGEVVGRTTDPNGVTRGFRLRKGVFSMFAFPGSDFTRARGGNDLGVATGNFFSTEGIEHGFVLDIHGMHQVDYPGSSTTDVWDVDDFGRLVGDYSDTVGLVHAFTARHGEFQTIDFPGAAQSSARGINLRGVVVGVAADADDTVEHGFIKVGSRYRQIDAPGSITTNAFRINNWGWSSDPMLTPTARTTGSSSPVPTRTEPGYTGGGWFVLHAAPGRV